MLKNMNNNVKIGILALIVIAGMGFYYWKINMSKQMMMEGKPTPTPLFVQGDEMKPPGTKQDITIQNFAFSPAELRIKKGETVVWTNKDSATHTVTALDGSFDSKGLNNAQTFSFTFENAGTFEYKCSFHSNMKATIIVE